MPRNVNKKREQKRHARNRKFIRKDSVSEYKSRAGMVEVNHTDGTATYFKPSDLFISQPSVEPSPKSQPCHYCSKPTIREKFKADGEKVPMCVMCGIEHGVKHNA